MEKQDNDEEGGHFLDEFMDDEFEKGTGPRRFSYRELARATNNSRMKKLGEGGFGGVYKGYLKDTNSYVAVKRISRGSKQGVKEQGSRESDVYSFGVVVLEIACGRRPINSMANEEGVHMVSWVWELYGRGKLLEAADPRLCGDFDKQEMKRLMIVGLWCAHPDKSLRPSISQSIHVLNFATSLPSLPLQIPVPTYLNTLVKLSFSLSCDPDITEGHQNQSSNNNYKTNSS
ncbi:hypothetical protein GH714_029113 [Hevea brasiliensis]|uniref:Serine-threonine/tyrosine-protein kinase catalytic domain-containing protein n=1 Tax=Hevea brasiliensis TaxID=3981 RepID=A0A6A6N4N6_HEVBR|nr:hypothetical protein GH714_029113 [Hevea brasiliensis]